MELLTPIERWVSSTGAKTCECMVTGLGKHNQDCPWEAMRRIYLTLLQPPAPAVPPAPEWFKEWWHLYGCGEKFEEAYAVYLKHAPKVDAGELAEAVVNYAKMVGISAASGPGLTAAIRAVLERGE